MLKYFASHFLFTVSFAILIVAAWAWWRSGTTADYLYRAEPLVLIPDASSIGKYLSAGNSAFAASPFQKSVTLARGIVSYKGALVIGKVEDSSNACPMVRYCHEIVPVVKSSGPGMVQARPNFLATFLGFGITTGEITYDLPGPFSFAKSLLNQRKYRAIYIPYYFFMLLALILPGLRLRRWIKVKNQEKKRAQQAIAELPAQSPPIEDHQVATAEI